MPDSPPPAEPEHATDRDGYRGLFDGHPAPMWVIDEQTQRFLAVNDAVLHKFGYARDELLAMGLRDVSPEEDADRLAAPHDELAPTDRTTPWRHRTAWGAPLSLEVSSSRVTFGGRPARLLVATEEVERRQREAALREQKEMLRSLLAHIPCGVFWKDRASIYLGCNDQVARDHGLAVPGEVVGRTDWEMAMTPEEAEASRAGDRRVVESGAALLNVEETRTGADGAKAALLTSRVPLRDAAGALVGVLGVYQDVTDRKQLEEQLRQSQKMEAIGRLASGVAHDFNNLLTIILGNVHLIRHLPAGDKAGPQLLDDIHDAGSRAAALTRQLLTFSRKHPTRPEILDLNAVVGGVAALLRRLLGERVEVRLQLVPTSLRIRADRGQIEQVVMNLAVNAKDAMPDGGTLTIATSEVTGAAPAGTAARAARFARLTISDTGIGMTPEVKARIFEPFFTTKEVGKGTGLGLATVYTVVEQARGNIEVESAPGAGATFRIRLPACDAPEPASSLIPISAATAGATGHGRSVLLVEDEDRLRKLAKYTLEGQGYTVAEANRGEAALALLTPDRRYDLLVTDLVMPGIDGRELAARVRAERPDIGVVFISGYVPDGRRLDDLAGALFLPKPFTPLDLVRVAVRAVGRVKGAREAREALAGRV